MNLFSKLTEYSQEKVLPMHMPGGKRKQDMLDFPNPYSIDITEISDFDNLHAAEGIIKSEQDRLASLYKVRQAHILVNGSTCGNLAALYATVSVRDTILIEKNSHKSIYNALELIGCKYRFIEEIVDKAADNSYEQIDSGTLLELGIKAVVVTYPSYRGVAYPLEKIAKSIHAADGILIVDSAHGAHLGFDGYFPRSAISQGADIVVVSLHKTLPALTQTAALLVNSDRVAGKKIEHALEIFETSSPSYVLLASVSKCLDYLQDNQEEIFAEYAVRLEEFYHQVEALRVLSVRTPVKTGDSIIDPSKIVLSVKDSGLCGRDLFVHLRDDYSIECEMYGSDYVLMMSTIMDSSEDLTRLAKAILDLDGRAFKGEISTAVYRDEKYSVLLELQPGDNSPMTITVYPPSVPIVRAGEKIKTEHITQIKKAIDTGLNIIIQEI